MNDIELLKEQLKQTQLACQMANQLSQFKAGFLARISHELRSPLSSLMALHQLILTDLCDNPEEEREFLTQAYNGARKLMKILDAIVAVSQLESGTSQLERRPLQLAKVFSQSYRLTYLQAANQNIWLTIIPPDPELYVLADWRRFLQVLVTLIDTAILYTEKGKIQVSAKVDRASDLIKINIEFPCQVRIGSEPVDFFQQFPEPTPGTTSYLSQTPELSLGTRLLFSQTLLEAMQGNLEVLDGTPEAAQEPLTRLQCSIPLASAAGVTQEWLEYSILLDLENLVDPYEYGMNQN